MSRYRDFVGDFLCGLTLSGLAALMVVQFLFAVGDLPFDYMTR